MKPIAFWVRSLDHPLDFDRPETLFCIVGGPRDGERGLLVSDIMIAENTELVLQHRVEDITWRRPTKRILWLDIVESLEDDYRFELVRYIPNFPTPGHDWSWLINAIPKSEYRSTAR